MKHDSLFFSETAAIHNYKYLSAIHLNLNTFSISQTAMFIYTNRHFVLLTMILVIIIM